MSNKTDVKLTFAEITALPRGDRYTLFQANVVKPFGAVAKAKEAVDEKMHNAMKLTASLKREYAAMLFAREIPPDMTEGKFFTQYCGGDVPARVKGLATFFNAVVLTGPKPLIPEEHIDAASVTSLEKAAPIIATERKSAGEAWMATEFTKEVVDALSKPGDATKKLLAIRKRQNPKADDEGGQETPTAALLALLLTRIADSSRRRQRLHAVCRLPRTGREMGHPQGHPRDPLRRMAGETRGGCQGQGRGGEAQAHPRQRRRTRAGRRGRLRGQERGSGSGGPRTRRRGQLGRPPTPFTRTRHRVNGPIFRPRACAKPEKPGDALARTRPLLCHPNSPHWRASAGA